MTGPLTLIGPLVGQTLWAILGMLIAGVFFSAFFSGTETGFYRVNRVRLVLGARGGDVIARWLLFLTNQPSLFVATTLTGNNLANYVTSLAIVLFTQKIFTADSHLAELIAPVALAPVLFVYGELLPKNLFLNAPFLLIRRAGPLFLLCAVLFAPVSVLLWLFGRMLGSLLGESPTSLRLTLARTELARVFDEGREAGILSPTQAKLVQNLFAEANHPVSRSMIPLARLLAVPEDAPRDAVLEMARRQKLVVVPVERRGPHGRELFAYVRVVDVALETTGGIGTVRPMASISSSQSQLAALTILRTSGEAMARVVGPGDKTLGVVTLARLSQPLLEEG